nr:MAG TPA: hypothetical protein [Bacteriophage sp.]
MPFSLRSSLILSPIVMICHLPSILKYANFITLSTKIIIFVNF